MNQKVRHCYRRLRALYYLNSPGVSRVPGAPCFSWERLYFLRMGTRRARQKPGPISKSEAFLVYCSGHESAYHQRTTDDICACKGRLSVAVWAASFIATKIALREIAPAAVVWLRFGIGVLVLAGFAGVRKEWAIVPARELRRFAMLGLLGIAFTSGCNPPGLSPHRHPRPHGSLRHHRYSSRCSDGSAHEKLGLFTSRGWPLLRGVHCWW